MWFRGGGGSLTVLYIAGENLTGGPMSRFAKKFVGLGGYFFLAVGLSVIVGTMTLDGGFVYDDARAILQNPLLQDLPWTEVFVRDFWGQTGEKFLTYRPLTPIVWRSVVGLFGMRPFPFRLLTLLLHLLNTALLFLLSKALFCSLLKAEPPGTGAGAREASGRAPSPQSLAGWTAIIFSVHAVHSEAVGAIVGQADLLANLLGMTAALLALRKEHPAWVALLLFLACSAKESALFYGIGILFLYGAESGWWAWRKTVPVLVVLLLVVTVQLSLHRGWAQLGTVNLIYAAQGWERPLYALYLVGRSVAMLFVPTGLAPAHGYATVDLDPWTLATYAVPGILLLLVGVVGGFWALWNRSGPMAFLLVLLFGSIILLSNLLLEMPTDLPERLLYTPSVASSIFLVLGVVRVNSSRRWITGVVLVLAALLLAQTWRSQRPWRSRVALWSRGAEVEPLSMRGRHHFYLALRDAGRGRESAWQLMVLGYGMERFPRPLDPYPVARARAWPLNKRLAEGPVLFAPGAPCRFARDLLRNLATQGQAGVAADLVPLFRERYGGCSGIEGFARPPGEREATRFPSEP